MRKSPEGANDAPNEIIVLVDGRESGGGGENDYWKVSRLAKPTKSILDKH